MIEGGGDKPHDCSACRGDGAYPCEVCKGARLVPVAKLKPSVAQAPLKTLRKARKQIEETLKLLGEFKPTGENSRKEVKQFKSIVAPAIKSWPELKKSQRMLEKVMKKLAGADVWRGNDEKRALAVVRYAAFTRVYLVHQQQLLDLCIERAEFNAEVLAQKK